MSLPSHFISCDWGTTNFRLRLVETDSLKVISEHKTDQGVKTLYQKFSEQNEFDQKTYYLNYLRNQIQELPAKYRHHLVISSGMSTSNIGLLELPYAALPFDKSGETFVHRKISLGEEQELLLISGIKSETGMMRGEEVQALGLEEYLIPYERGVLLLPGTHCKHISYRQGSFYALKNFMTGELFEVLGNKSILANSIEKSEWDANHKKEFLEGFHLGLTAGLTPNLLRIRARHVVENKSKKENHFMLSGLLIGDELSYLKNTAENVFLTAPKTMIELYRTGLETFIDPSKLIVLNENILERALLIGQRKILEQHAT
ncbi:2-dehydro-3-deoxygalactonokinase [Maribacter halichondriae]|uniref:2-dehydro-3-deoxygalactonokinase n=1 Tax=Maribacter halichondriae TaxID=2980554 RepID=UPI00235947C7|nr:2-dehydro-3-deoxygalactonokinase [Maribacter sp. Hal144]